LILLFGFQGKTLMSCTDENLKRLKFKMENAMNAEQTILVSDPDAILALIARLKAAEAVIKEADDHGFTDKAIELHTVWEKSKGA
jgi:hypothetical protein